MIDFNKDLINVKILNDGFIFTHPHPEDETLAIVSRLDLKVFVGAVSSFEEFLTLFDEAASALQNNFDGTKLSVQTCDEIVSMIRTTEDRALIESNLTEYYNREDLKEHFGPRDILDIIEAAEAIAAEGDENVV